MTETPRLQMLGDGPVCEDGLCDLPETPSAEPTE